MVRYFLLILLAVGVWWASGVLSESLYFSVHFGEWWAWYPCAMLVVAHVGFWWALAGASFWWASGKLLLAFCWCGLWVGCGWASISYMDWACGGLMGFGQPSVSFCVL